MLIKLGDSEFNIDAYVMELGEVDVILGVVWLETPGKVIMDSGEMSMVFNNGGKEVK